MIWITVTSRAPGFFEMRSIKDLFAAETKWGDLTLEEICALQALGWDPMRWDCKYDLNYHDIEPKSVNKHWTELTPEEKIGIVHLRFHAYEDYKKEYWKAHEKNARA